MNKPTAGLVVLCFAMVACGGTPTLAPNDSSTNRAPVESGSDGASGTDGGATASSEVTPEAPGALQPNTIRIGSQVWTRTLPMTSGQCLVIKADGTLPDWSTVWGTVDGDDDTRFSANYKQDGTFESELTNNFDQYWGAGTRFQGDEADLVIELDFENLIVSGNGTFKSLTTGELAKGSFLFTCEPEDQ